MRTRKNPEPHNEIHAVNLRTNVTDCRRAINLSANHPANIVLGIEINHGTTLNIQPLEPG